MEATHELHAALERAAIKLSDALTGGGVYAVHGREAHDILRNAYQREAGLISALETMNLILRKLDKRRKLPPMNSIRDQFERECG